MRFSITAPQKQAFRSDDGKIQTFEDTTISTVLTSGRKFTETNLENMKNKYIHDVHKNGDDEQSDTTKDTLNDGEIEIANIDLYKAVKLRVDTDQAIETQLMTPKPTGRNLFPVLNEQIR